MGPVTVKRARADIAILPRTQQALRARWHVPHGQAKAQEAKPCGQARSTMAAMRRALWPKKAWQAALVALALVGAVAPSGQAADFWGPSLPPSPVGRPNFLWGTTIAGVQNEGAPPTSDWAGAEAAGRLPERSGLGPDFRGHMSGDLDRAASVGLNAFRFSMEWARLEPREGWHDPAEVAHLHRLLAGLKARKMTPIVTLHHFATPSWVCADEGDGKQGWEKPRTVAAFARHVAWVAKEFGQEVDWYVTINEASTLVAGGYLLGWIPPHHQGVGHLMEASQKLLEAHGAAYAAIKANDGRSMVGLAEYHAYAPVIGNDNAWAFTPSHWAAFLLPRATAWNGQARPKDMDFIAMHYYGLVDPVAASRFPVEPWRWGVSTRHFESLLSTTAAATGLPILIAENGLATQDGRARPDGWNRAAYLVAHVEALQRAARKGVPILGYLHWTLTDNYEWGSYAPRFGLWGVECKRGDLQRVPTPAVEAYRAVVKAGGVTEEIQRRYPPPPPLAQGSR